MTSRSDVYAALDGERAYQDKRWCESQQRPNEPAHQHTPEEWLTYIEDYVNEAKHILSREDAPGCFVKAMNIMRKITAMGVAAMEQNGAPQREGY